MPRPGKIEKKPSPHGAKILKICLERFGSIAAAARAAGLPDATLRRRIYNPHPARLGAITVDRLTAIGIPRELLNAAS